MKTNIFAIAIFSLLLACSSDDSNNNTDDDGQQTSLEEAREITTQVLASGLSKTWKITNAVLTNNSSTLNISTNFNVVDDEFIFSTEGNLEWRQRNDIGVNGTTNQETLLDYYRSPITTNYQYNTESSTELSSINGRFNFTVLDENTINGVLTYDNASEIALTLNQKLPEDYIQAPLSGLTFTEAFIYESNMVSCCAPGMIGSYSDNSLFIVNREDDLSNNGIVPERIIKFDINTGISEENLFFNPDFVSKQLHIVNNELIVIGGQFVNTYPLNLSTEPTSIPHGLTNGITRFGMAVTEDDAYLIGGDLGYYDNGTGTVIIEAEKIYKWNLTNQNLEYVTSMPEDRFGARSTIVNNKLYAFGGTTEFATYGTGNNSIYIYDIENGTIETESMTSVAEYTYVDKFENLIYIAGYYSTVNDQNESIDRTFFIGTYDTESGTYQEIPTNLSQEGYNAIHGMCIFNNKMYVIYGLFDENLPDTAQWQIMAADIN